MSEDIHIDRATVELALTLAPDRCPQPNDDDRTIWVNVGMRRLAEALRDRLTIQEEGNR